MITLVRGNGISGDSRVRKYLNYYEHQNLNYHVIGWDRLNEGLRHFKTTFYNKKIGYNVGGLKAALGRLGWFIFVFRQLLKTRPSTIHACDLDCAFPAAIYKSFFPTTTLIFDVFDWFSATLYNQASWLRYCFRGLEKFTTRKADHIIICEEERRAQIPYEIDEKMSILPNIPMIERATNIERKSLQFSNSLPTVAYVGAFYKERFIQELIQLAYDGKINLLMAGYGDNEITRAIQAIETKDNVKYYGKVDYPEGLAIMNSADILYAMYCTTNPNNVCAAPNKFYESLLLGKPLITTKGTTIGDKASKYRTGYVIHEEYNELLALVEHIRDNRNELEEFGKNARMVWNSQFKDYVARYLDTTYKSIIR